MRKLKTVDVMSNLLNIFSSREIALFVWFLIFLIFISRTKAVRHSMGAVIKALCKKKLILTFGSLIIYVLIVVSGFYCLGFWDISLLKDTCFWILFSGFLFFMDIDKSRETSYLSKLVRNSFKFTIIVEFICNFYTFNLISELIIIPVILIFTILQVYSEYSSTKNPEDKKVATLSKNILGGIGLVGICYVFYKTIIEYELLFTCANLKSFLLPIVLFVLTIPYFYLLALYVNYEELVTNIKCLHRNESPSVSKNLIKATFRYANLNLNAVIRIQHYYIHFDSSKDNPFDYIKKVSRKTKYSIGNTAKLTIFNNVQNVINNLSNNGLGKLSEWHSLNGVETHYNSLTTYYKFGNDDIIPNTLAYYLNGEETYLKQLDLVLIIGYQQNRQQAIERFIELLKLTFDSLSILKPEDLIKSIIAGNVYSQEYSTHKVQVNYEKLELSEIVTFSIVTN